MMKSPKILVMGAGGIGGITAAYLTAAGHDVTAISTNAAIRDAVSAKGFTVIVDGKPQHIPGRIAAAPAGIYDMVILATQPPSVEEAATTALPFLAADGRMLVLQNGLCEERVAAIVGAERVVGAIVAWGASMPQPGQYEQTAKGGFSLGRLDGAIDQPLREIASVLTTSGPSGNPWPVKITTNLRGARWSKLALNAAISSLGTIAGARLGTVVRTQRYRRLALEIMTEVVEVAHASGVKLEKVAGTMDLDWVALTDAEKHQRGSAALVAKHALLLAVGMKYRRMRSSMLAAIERGRVPAIDFLNGEVAQHGRQRGVATPVNDAIVAAVWAIAKGEKSSSFATLDGVIAALRR
jgi:2-dehydropantoate 2-reductase